MNIVKLLSSLRAIRALFGLSIVVLLASLVGCGGNGAGVPVEPGGISRALDGSYWAGAWMGHEDGTSHSLDLTNFEIRGGQITADYTLQRWPADWGEPVEEQNGTIVGTVTSWENLLSVDWEFVQSDRGGGGGGSGNPFLTSAVIKNRGFILTIGNAWSDILGERYNWRGDWDFYMEPNSDRSRAPTTRDDWAKLAKRHLKPR